MTEPLNASQMHPALLRKRQEELARQQQMHKAALATNFKGQRVSQHAPLNAPAPNPQAAPDPRHNPAKPVSHTSDLKLSDGAYATPGVTHRMAETTELDKQMLEARLKEVHALRQAKLQETVKASIDTDVQSGSRVVEVKVLDDTNITPYLLNNKKPVMVLFTLTSCVACMEMKQSTLPRIVKQWYEHIDFVEFRCTQASQFDKDADVDRHPTVILFKAGVEIGITNGTANAPYWNEEINKLAHLLGIPRKSYPQGQ